VAGPTVAIDRITILSNDTPEFLRKIDASLYLGRRGFSPDPYRYQYQSEDGFFVQVAEHGREVPDVRIDFNPNSVKLDVVRPYIDLLGDDRRFSRLDYAVDFTGVEGFSKLYWMDDKTRKRSWWTSRSGELETLYLGAPSSDLRHRIYNKAVEQGVEGNWWRVEAQVRFSNSNRDYVANPFSCISAGWVSTAHLPLSMRATVEYLVNHREAWSEMASATRAKYRRLVRDCMAVMVPSPSDVFENEKNRLVGELAVWLGYGDLGQRPLVV
jgi:hypothetical protein